MIFKQDVQSHTIFSDGKNTVLEMVEVAIENGLKSIVISDHAKGWISGDKKVEFFSDIGRYVEYINEINNAKNNFNDKIKVLSALEIEIDINGNFKLDNGVQEYQKENLIDNKIGMDILIGSIHSESFQEDCVKFGIEKDKKREILIENMCNLIKNKQLDIFAHPFQALHGHFSNNLTDLERNKIIDVFKEEWSIGHNIFLEINGKKYPTYEQWSEDKYQKGLIKTNDKDFINSYKTAGGKFVIGSDSHSVDSFGNIDLSILEDINLKDSDIHIF